MTAAAPRTASTAPDARRLGLALLAVIVTAALLVGLALSRPASIGQTVTPQVITAPGFDHGSSSDPHAQDPVRISVPRSNGNGTRIPQ